MAKKCPNTSAVELDPYGGPADGDFASSQESGVQVVSAEADEKQDLED